MLNYPFHLMQRFRFFDVNSSYFYNRRRKWFHTTERIMRIYEHQAGFFLEFLNGRYLVSKYSLQHIVGITINDPTKVFFRNYSLLCR